MAIESRGNGRFYYRKRRVGRKVISEYVGIGGGYAAQLVQLIDDDERQEAEQKRQAWQAIKDHEKELDAMLDDVTKTVNAYTGALLLVNGYHQHKRQWRKQK